VIRPRPGGAPDRTRLKFGLAFLPLAAIGAVRALRSGAGSGLWDFAFVPALIVVAILARAKFFAQTSIRVGPTRLRRTGYLGRSAGCLRAAIARVVEVNAVTSRIVRTFAQLRREVPGSFPWTLAHIWLTFALVVSLAVIVGGVVAGSS
jgi:hypothetical protein